MKDVANRTGSVKRVCGRAIPEKIHLPLSGWKVVGGRRAAEGEEGYGSRSPGLHFSRRDQQRSASAELAGNSLSPLGQPMSRSIFPVSFLSEPAQETETAQGWFIQAVGYEPNDDESVSALTRGQ